MDPIPPMTPAAKELEREVQIGRATRPAAVTDLRTKPRLSIAELNETDIDTIKERMQSYVGDTRGPVTKFLDIIDVPRNAVVGAIAPGLRKKMESEGTTGTFGRGKVFFSDVLGELGMRPGIARGVLGFVGDVALDPITWLGPPGWGAKLASGGKALEIGAMGARANRNAANAIRAGKDIADPVIKEVFEAYADDAVRAAKGPDKAKFLNDTLSGRLTTGKAGKAARLAFGGDLSYEGSRIVDDFDRVGNVAKMNIDDIAKIDAPMADLVARANMGEPVGHVIAKRFEDLAKRDRQVEAAKNYVNRYGRGGGDGKGFRVGQKGLLFGNAGSAVAHVPGTEYGIYVPAFTAGAGAAVAARAQALAKSGAPAAAQHVMKAYGASSDFPRVMADMEAKYAELDQLRAARNDPAMAAETAFDEAGNIIPLTDAIDTNIATVQKEIADTLGAFRTRVLDLNKDWADLKARLPENMTIGDLQATREMMELAQSQLAHAEETLKASPFYELIDEKTKNFGSLTSGREQALEPGGFLAFRNKILEDVSMAADGDESVRELDTFIANQRGIVGEEELAPLIKQRDDTKQAVMESMIRDRLKPHQQAIVAMADEDIEKSAQMADAIHAHARSLIELHGRAASTLTDSMAPSSLNTLSNVAKWQLGLTDAVLGASMFGPMEAAAKLVFDKYRPGKFADMSAYGRVKLGNRAAGINDPAARAIALARGGGYDQAEAALEPVIPILRSALNDANFKIPESELDTLMTVVIAKAYQRHPDKFDSHFYPKLINGDDEPTIALLKEAQAKGFLNEQQYPGLGKKLDEIADYMVNTIRELGDLGLEEQTLSRGQIMDAHIPHVPDQAFAKLASVKQAKSDRAAFKGTSVERFQKPRSTYKYQFKDREGKLREFTEADWHYLHNNPETLAREAQEKPEITAILEDIAEFKAIYGKLADDDVQRPLLLGRPMTILEINKRKREGQFNYITGMDDGLDRIFSENLLHILPQRIHAQFRAASRRQWRAAYEHTALRTNERLSESSDFANGKAFTFVNGTKGIADGKGNIIVGNVRYRPLNAEKLKDAFNDDSLLSGLMKHEDLVNMYPEQVAEQIERIAEMSSRENVTGIVKAVEMMNTLWKGYTLLHPSWIMFNGVGNVWNLATNRVPMDSYAKLMAPSIKAWQLSKHPSELAKMSITVNGDAKNADQLWMLSEQLGVTKTGLALGYAQDMNAMGGIKPNDTLLGGTFKERLMRQGRQLKEGVRRQNEFDLAAKKYSGDPSSWQTLKSSLRVMKDEKYMGKLFAQWNAVNSALENTMRFNAWLAWMDKGFSPAEAAAEVKKALFDYTDMTKAEEGLRRRWMPFYAWMRNNGAFQLKMLLENPKWAAMAPKLKEAIEEAVAGEEAVPEWARPMWMREELAVQLGSDPEKRKALTAGSVIPSEPIAKVGQALTGVQGQMAALKYFTGMVNPWVQMAFSLSQGRDVYTGREIGAGPGEGDLTAAEYVAGQFRPIRELIPLGARKSPLGRAAEEGVGAVAGRLFVGGRLQPFGQEKLDYQKTREFKDKEAKIRKYVAVAEREGNKKESLRGRVMLMDFYRTGMKQGMEKEVPVWARKQLAAFSP